MQSLWSNDAAALANNPVALCAYASRLVGADTALVMHGGGNTSIKVDGVLHVKGTGSDLAHVDETSFTPLHLACARGVLNAACEDNAAMKRALDSCIARSHAPKPSIETLMHAGLPQACVNHTHASAVLAALNVDGIETVHAHLFGELAPLVPYQHSGHGLARACMAAYEQYATDKTLGLVLAFHGIVSFGDNVREAYERMVTLVTRAEDFLKSRQAWDLPYAATMDSSTAAPRRIANLCNEISRLAGVTLTGHTVRTPQTRAFAARSDLKDISQQGPSTPQHAVYTRRVPLIDGDAAAYATRYRAYLAEHLGKAAMSLDPAPRIVLDPEFGLLALGKTSGEAAMAAQMYARDIEIISRACAHGRYRCAPAHALALAEFEYGGHAGKYE